MKIIPKNANINRILNRPHILIARIESGVRQNAKVSNVLCCKVSILSYC